jgi:hypothetical protein
VRKVRPTKQARNPIQRFPRYPTAGDIGNMAKRIWKRPKFKFRQTHDSTEFIFTLPFNVPKKIKKKAPALYYLLFDPKRTPFGKILVQAYRAAYSERTNKARDLCDRALYKVFAESLAILFEEADRTEGLYKGYKSNLLGDAAVVREAAKRKRRPPDSERRALAKRIAKRYGELFPKVKELWKFIRDSPLRFDESKLREAVEQSFPHEWIKELTKGIALENLPEIPGHPNATESLGKLEWSPRQLAVGIIWCEERRRSRNFSVRPNTMLDDYLPLGNKLNRNAR